MERDIVTEGSECYESMEEGFALGVKNSFTTLRILTMSFDHHVNNRERIFQTESSKCTQAQSWERGWGAAAT